MHKLIYSIQPLGYSVHTCIHTCMYIRAGVHTCMYTHVGEAREEYPKC